ncbi:MAG: hypothetical protein ABS95_02310 [Verrucomicrobia bacterium SCN 57-15]|nr:MAG: hypothetical protein ABS95_02310 [Verrucomicrobia bacterium SCN 57-15]
MNTTDFNLERIRVALKGSKERCPWQRLLDLGYHDWQKPENRKWCYRDMVERAGETYGEVVKLFILLGAANHQICNGGFLQYFDNGYASGEGGCFHRHDEDILLHKEMLTLAGKYGLHQSETGSTIYAILAAFRIVLCDDSESEEEDDGCRQGDVSNTDELDALDARYYAVNEKWVKALKVLAAQWLKGGTNPITEIGPLPPRNKPASRPRVKLVGRDGNAFAIIGRVCEALRKAGASAETVSQYRQESMSGDYGNVLATAMKYCDVH